MEVWRVFNGLSRCEKNGLPLEYFAFFADVGKKRAGRGKKGSFRGGGEAEKTRVFDLLFHGAKTWHVERA